MTVTVAPARRVKQGKAQRALCTASARGKHSSTGLRGYYIHLQTPGAAGQRAGGVGGQTP